MRAEDSDLRRLKWIAVLAPVLFLSVIEIIRWTTAPGIFDAWPGYLLIGLVVLLATLLFAEMIFGIIGQMQERLTRQNLELLALHDAGLAITGELELERVLQRVVDQARELGSARYGALSMLSEGGGIQAFLTSGISAEERERIGPIPVGHGLLKAVFNQSEPIRMADLTTDPRSVGFPPHHPPMHSLLGVPILSRGRILGSLYLTEKEDADTFDENDQRRLERFATQAALAIENARLHQQVRALAVSEERERIAREMHDSIAQVLGYVNTKAQAAQELLKGGQNERAEQQISQLSQAAREAYADVRENIMGLRTSLDAGRNLIGTLSDYLTRWEDQSQVRATLKVDAADEADIHLTSLAELQLLRIIQEALTNVRKHAAATQVVINISDSSDGICATITDDGTGFNPEDVGRRQFPRFGLATMRERAEAVNGTLSVESSPGQGTTITVRIPHDARPTLSIGDQRASAHR